MSISLLHAAIRTSAGQSQFPEQHMCYHATSLAPEVRDPSRGEKAEENPKMHEKSHYSVSMRHNGIEELNKAELQV